MYSVICAFSLKITEKFQTFIFTGHFELLHKEIHLLKNVPLQHERLGKFNSLARKQMLEETINISPLRIVLVLFYLLLVSKVFPTVKEHIQEFTTHGMVLLLFCVQRHLLQPDLASYHQKQSFDTSPLLSVSQQLCVHIKIEIILFIFNITVLRHNSWICGSSSLAKTGNPKYVEDIKSGKAETPFEIIGLQKYPRKLYF